MPNIKINKNEFEELVGEEVPEEELKEEASFLGAHWNPEEEEKWNVEVYPDRPDLLSVEGLARAYRGFFGIDPGYEDYSVSGGDLEIRVEESVEEVRPHIGGAVIRDIQLSERIINGLIQFQEKLHESFGRRRDKLAIGLHDLSTVEPPFTYRAVEPEQVSFKPLEYGREMQLGEILEEHEKGREYAWILEDEDRYPVIVDSDDRVLSFPPVINNQLTEIHSGTDDIFVDVTGKDKETVLKALNILVTALTERGGKIESVEVDGEQMPDLEPEEWRLELDYFKTVSGLEISGKEVVERLEKMKFGARKKNGTVKVDVPAYRTDIMHPYDLIEDVVIAHGYRNIDPELPEIDQIGEERDIEDFTGILRDILQGSGALEAHTYILSNREKLFERMEVEPEKIVTMSNALTGEYTAVRNWVLPSLLGTLERNRHRSYPQKFFEVGEVSVLDDTDTGASNQRKLAYVASDTEVDYTDAREVLQLIERDLGVEFEVRSTDKGCFADGRSAAVFVQDEKVGVVGEFSQDVVENWNLENQVAGFELDAEKLMEIH